MGGPPPPPPPPAADAAAGGGDFQSQLFAQIRGGFKLRKVNRDEPRGRQKKVEEIDPEAAAAARKAQLEEERQNLIIEMLGYMQAPNGSLDELTDKLKKNTATARGFIYTMVRRGWCNGFRVLSEEDQKGVKPCAVWPGMEVTNGLELDTHTPEHISQRFREHQIVMRAHMYRFDARKQQHVIDEIVLVATPKLPPKLVPFTEPEPKQDTREGRNQWEAWNARKLAHQQSDAAQFDLVYGKLSAFDRIVVATYEQLLGTISQMREMSDAVKTAFDGVPVKQLRKIVDTIPERIKEVAKKLRQQNGILISDENVKLTPAFLQSLNLAPAAENGAESKEGSAAVAVAAAEGVEKSQVEEAVVSPAASTPTSPTTAPKTLVTFGGVPVEDLLPVLKNLYPKTFSGGAVRRMPTI
ncbi:hypothetical protein HK102_003661 [Quaeritorhiza haematococci]|nr:hypothetical protein HK102_003661 [Quaeritorhiza haematococci]